MSNIGLYKKKLCPMNEFSIHLVEGYSLFYEMLSKFVVNCKSGKIKRKKNLFEIKRLFSKLNRISLDNSQSLDNKKLLIEAVIAQLEGDFHAAIGLYDKSIDSAKHAMNHFDEALACELAARYSISLGNEDVAVLYLHEARNAYTMSGSTANADIIDSEFEHLLSNPEIINSAEPFPGKNSTSDNTLESFDLAAVIKASHLISGEIMLDSLFEKLIKILSENAGADKVFIILEEDGKLRIEAMSSAIDNKVILNQTLSIDDSGMVPVSIVNYVKRTREYVVLNNAAREGKFMNDPYIMDNNIKSVVCFPLLRQQVVNGIVYLENSLSAGVFSSERLEMIKLLSTQATISLENAMLFEKTKKAEYELQQQYEEIQSQYEEMESMNDELEKTYRKLLDVNEEIVIFKKFAEASGQGMGMSDLSQKITYANPALCNVLKETNPVTVIGKSFNSYYSKESFKKIKNEIFNILIQGGEWEGEMDVITSNGDVVPTFQSFFSIRDNAGKLLLYATIVTDITDRKKLEGQLIQSQKMEAVGRLAGGIAHDFNNLLTAIIGYSQMILNDMSENDKNRGDLNEILKAADRSSSLTRQLLAFSRKQILKPSIIDLNNVVKNIGKMLNRLIGEDIHLVTLLMENIDHVKADKGQVEQIIMNIIVNARDAMPNGGTITITTGNKIISKNEARTIPDSRPGKFVCLTIEDTGIGIDDKIIKMIFEPFFSTKSPDKGTGLGLSVVYGIVAQHNGWISVTSKVDEGTSFNIYLPSTKVKINDTVKKINKTEIVKGRGERILLVEDQIEVMNFTSKALKKNGYNIFEASSGSAAIKLFEQENGLFDLVFSDVVLPDIKGTIVADYVKSQRPEIPIILSSGYADKQSQLDTIREKGYRFLEKPYFLNDLLLIINEVLQSQRK